MKFFDDDLVKNLPDAYRKDSESNNYKILQIEKYSMDEFRKTLNEIYESHLLLIQKEVPKYLKHVLNHRLK